MTARAATPVTRASRGYEPAAASRRPAVTGVPSVAPFLFVIVGGAPMNSYSMTVTVLDVVATWPSEFWTVSETV
jgi:hypothetical protein